MRRFPWFASEWNRALQDAAIAAAEDAAADHEFDEGDPQDPRQRERRWANLDWRDALDRRYA